MSDNQVEIFILYNEIIVYYLLRFDDCNLMYNFTM